MEIRLLAVKTVVVAGAGQDLSFDDVTLTVQPDPGSIGLAGWYIDDVEITAPIP